MKGIRIYLIGFKNALASRMAYRVDLFFSIVIMLVFELSVPFFTFLIYRNGGGFPGWEFDEVLLVQAVFLLSKGFTFPFFAGIVWNTIIRIQDGTFDLLLIRPRNTLFMTLVTGIDIEDLGKLAGGIAIFAFAVSRLKDPGAANWFFFIGLFLCSIMVFSSFAFIMAASGFTWVGNFRVYEIFEAITAFAMYPASIFSKSLRFVVTTAIPLALMGFFPASVLLGKPTAGVFISLTSCCILFAFGIIFWHRMLRTYTSAGG
jgi:ABC-2 type transport system permease protein